MTDKLEIELVESALTGSIDSFGELCTRYYNSMVAIAYSVLADHHLARDAAQETFARALQNLEKLKRKQSFAVWLAGICRNVALDMAKAKSRHVNIEDHAHLHDTATENFDPHPVRQAIERLSPSERELIVLRYYNKLSHQQMSAVLGLTKPAINNRLSRARRKIAEYLQRNGFSKVQL
ncbi:MAG: RNA polymerase sigma factor [Planctomycetota bacterium]